MTTHHITIRLRFEAAHRLPHLPGKCTNLHGHSWQAHITAAAPHLNQKDMVVDFSDLKRAIETFTDTHLDHGAMLGAADPYASRLGEDGLKTYVFGTDPHTEDLSWPTVESVAVLLGRVAHHALTTHPTLKDAHLVSAQVSETENNTATYTPQEGARQ